MAIRNIENVYKKINLMNKILFSTQNTHIKGVFMDNKIIVRKKTNPATIAIIECVVACKCCVWCNVGVF